MAVKTDAIGKEYDPVSYEVGREAPAIFDDEVGIDFSQIVHGGQEFVWGEPVCAGDTITTSAKVADISARDGKGFYVFESVSTNQEGDRRQRQVTDLSDGVATVATEAHQDGNGIIRSATAELTSST